MIRCLLAILTALPLLAQGCKSATPECQEKIPLGAGYSLVYRNFPLTQPNPKIERAMIIIHGAGRNANDYFQTGMASAYLAGALENTLVISPRFAGNDGKGCKDPLADGEIAWDCGGWKNGFESINTKGVYSYDFLDQLLLMLDNKAVFPNLKGIVLSGHSAGGQIANRYGAANKVHEKISVPVRYVVSNPSSYVYPDNLRPPRDFVCDAKGKCAQTFRAYSDRSNCTTYNDWMHGLDNLKGYAAGLTAEKIREQLLRRPMVFLLGELDTLPIAGFDSSCISMAQGPTRFDRGKAYFAHLQSQHKAANKSLVVVPLCGHNNRCIWTADQALPVLFPEYPAKQD
jgi:pimeloyl-ACP methyl ester carboxylesterase